MDELELRHLLTVTALAPTDAIVGQVFALSVIGDNELVTFTSSDPIAVLPAPIDKTNFWLTMPVTLNTPGTQTITANGSTVTIEVAPAPALGFHTMFPPPLSPEQVLRIYGPKPVIVATPPVVPPPILDTAIVVALQSDIPMWESLSDTEDSDVFEEPLIM